MTWVRSSALVVCDALVVFQHDTMSYCLHVVFFKFKCSLRVTLRFISDAVVMVVIAGCIC